MAKTEWASWIQAVGSIVAIAGAGIGIWWQVAAQRRQALTVRTDQVELIALAVDWCRAYAYQLELGNSGGMPVFTLGRLEYWVKKLREIPLLSFPEAAIQNAVCLVIETMSQVERLQNSGGVWDEAMELRFKQEGANLFNVCDLTNRRLDAWAKKNGVKIRLHVQLQDRPYLLREGKPQVNQFPRT